MTGDGPEPPGTTRSDHAASPAEEAVPRWTIRPEPTDEELVALVTVLTTALAGQAVTGAPAPGPSRWARAGRLAALNRWPGATARGWRRG